MNVKLGAMNNPAKSLLEEIKAIWRIWLDFLDLTVEYPEAYKI